MIVKRHNIVFWKAYAYFCVVDNDEFPKLDKRFGFTFDRKRFEFKNVDGFAWTEQLIDGGQHYFLVVRPKVKDSVLAHECVHMAMQILEDRGIESKCGNNEPLAFLVEYLFDEVKKVVK